MVGASTEIVNTGTLPALTFGPYMNVILGLSLTIMMGQSGFMRK